MRRATLLAVSVWPAVSGAVAALLVPGLTLAQPSPTGTVFGAGAGLASPQAPGRPPRDVQPPPTGTSRIRGRVTAADTGQPLRRAIVQVSSPELRGARSTATDADGLYEFRDLPAGRYSVAASKGSYVRLQYGQRRPREMGTPVTLAEGQSLDKVDMALPRGAVITGRVVDEFGEPVVNAGVMPMQQQYMQGARRLMMSGGSSQTNDAGEFRLFGLAPGAYYLAATLRSETFGDSDEHSGYAPTYYPGTTDLADAQRLDVQAGQIVTDLTIPLVLTRTARLSGSVFDRNGNLVATGAVGAAPQGSAGTPVQFQSYSGPIRPDGTFAIGNVPPGDYLLSAFIPNTNGSSPGERSTATVSVSGADVTGIRLAPVPPVTITGRVIVSSAAGPSLKASSIRVMAIPGPNDPSGPMMRQPGTPVGIRDDYSFTMEAAPGSIRLQPIVTAPDWTMKAVRLRGTDITDTGLDLRSGEDVADIELELTTAVSEISGVVSNARGEPSTDYTVIVFARERSRWNGPTRYTGVGRPDQQGRFRIRGLPQGDYQAVALESVDGGAWQDPDFLEALVPSAQGLSLHEGETKTITLRLH